MKKDAYWFPHDSNARSDLKMKKLLRVGGLEAIGLYWCVIEMLRSESSYSLPTDTIDDICYDLRIETEPFYKIVDCELLIIEDGFFFSDSLKSRMQRWDEKRKKLQKNGRKGGRANSEKKNDDSNCLAIATDQPSNCLAIATDQPSNCSSNNRIEQNRTEQKRREQKKEQSSENAKRISGLLFDSLMGLKPDRRDVKKNQIERWASDIDKLNRIDGRDWNRIEALITWLFESYQPTNNFDWRDNIKSGKKLRAQFDRLEIEKNKRPAQQQKPKSLYERNREMLGVGNEQ